MLSFFEECIIVFQAPAQFPKIKMPRILLSIKLIILVVAHIISFNGLTKKGKSTGNRRFSHDFYGFPVFFPNKTNQLPSGYLT